MNDGGIRPSFDDVTAHLDGLADRSEAIMGQITRREFLKASVAGAATLAAGGLALADSGGGKRPNILLIIDDQHNRRHMGWTGASQVKTPHLDSLARGSVRFTNAYCNSPICGPARHCIYTGLHTPQHGSLMNEQAMRDGLTTMVARLNAAGYTTANVGKMHNAPYTDRRDFQYVLHHEFFISDTGATHYGPWLRKQLAARGLKNRTGAWNRPASPARSWLADPNCVAHINPMPEDLTPERWTTDQSLAFVSDQLEHRPDKPFFLHASYFPPHHPYAPIRKYAKMYDPAKMKLPPNFDADRLKRWCTGKRRPASLDADGVRRWMAMYFGFITQLDAEIGRLLDGLKRLGAADSTIVIFTSDHGDLMGEHGVFYKGLMYEGSVGVPMLIRSPGVTPRDESATVSHVDLPATVLSAAGVEVPTEYVGDDLAPLMAGKAWKDGAALSVIHHRLPFSQIMWRRGDWKLIGAPLGRRTRRVRYSLYNLAKDPWEKTDLAADPASAATLATLKAELADYWRPLAKLVPATLPPAVKTPRCNFTWPTDPWKPVKPV